MIYNRENMKGKRVDVRDARGHSIKNVVSYDSDKSEVVVFVECEKPKALPGMLIATASDGEPILARGFAPGSSIWIDGVKK